MANWLCSCYCSLTITRYQNAIRIISKTLEPFSANKNVPCFGFGDETTSDKTVFPIHIGSISEVCLSLLCGVQKLVDVLESVMLTAITL